MSPENRINCTAILSPKTKIDFLVIFVGQLKMASILKIIAGRPREIGLNFYLVDLINVFKTDLPS
jgi:hypothetical protein